MPITDMPRNFAEWPWEALMTFAWTEGYRDEVCSELSRRFPDGCFRDSVGEGWFLAWMKWMESHRVP